MEQTEELEYLIGLLTKELAAKPEHIRAVIRLLDEGATAPFIARYRKEQHGGMDDQPSACWRSDWSICGVWLSAVAR